MSASDTDQLAKLRGGIIDKQQPIAKRTHAAFLLRTHGTEAAADVLCEALCQRDDSTLLRHELGYILGQMRMPKFCPALASILQTEDEDPLVRHECAEALGAIGDPSALPVLQQFVTHPLPEIAETCQIAVDLIEWREQQRVADAEGRSETGEVSRNPFQSVDPAPPFKMPRSITAPAEDSSSVSTSSSSSSPQPRTVEDLQQILTDAEGQTLFNRYRAMFTLRNLNTDEAAVALAAGFGDNGALFKHEVAYVLGQMQRAVTVPHLAAVLRDTREHKMVRHEAAEAMGAVGGAEVEAILREYNSGGTAREEEAVVRESAEVALDTMDYWNSFSSSSSSEE